MVKISEDIKQLIRNEGVIIVGTVDESGLSNISPRSTFHVTDDNSSDLSESPLTLS